MHLTSQQEDSLTEIVNIGYGRAAAALSEMTSARVTLEVPSLYIFDLDQADMALRGLFPTRVTCVNQMFSGPIQGNALLLLDDRAAALLTSLVTNEPAPVPEESVTAETITEVGNIVLNACLGVFGNLLQLQVKFTVPNLTVSTVDALLRSIMIEDETLSHALLVHTRFTLRDSNVKGYLAIILGVTSLTRVVDELDRFD